MFPQEMHAERFDSLCAWLAGYAQVLPLTEAVARWKRGELPARALAITFDDGYEDNVSVAMPILQRHGLTATFYITTGFLNGGCMWNDRVIEALRLAPSEGVDFGEWLTTGPASLADWEARRQMAETLLLAIKYLPTEQRLEQVHHIEALCGAQRRPALMMSDAGVQALRGGAMEVGAHTCSHPILSRLSLAEAEREIADGRDHLEALLREPVRQFAYPNGKPGQDYLPDVHPGLVQRLGFDAAVSTAWGAARRGDDAYQLPRFSPWDLQPWRYQARLLHNLRR